MPPGWFGSTVREISCPLCKTARGEIGVMSGHIPTESLKRGFVKVKFHYGTEYIAVSDGFVEVRKDKVSIIVQTAETAREIDVERARLAKARDRFNS